MSDATLLRRITRAAEKQRQAGEHLQAAVAEARDAGCTWAQIGAALGVTRQTAQIRFGRQT